MVASGGPGTFPSAPSFILLVVASGECRPPNSDGTDSSRPPSLPRLVEAPRCFWRSRHLQPALPAPPWRSGTTLSVAGAFLPAPSILAVEVRSQKTWFISTSRFLAQGQLVSSANWLGRGGVEVSHS